jgi:serine/threonine protein kinase
MSTSRAAPTTDHAWDETVPQIARVSAGQKSETSAPDDKSSWPGHVDDSADGVSRDSHELRHDRFKIGDKLGEGGMGVVYRALDTLNGREVALKLMKGSLAGTARRRFEREFHSLSALHHPHCLSVFDYGELDRGPFFTMELFKGRPITSLAGLGVEELLNP